MKTAALPIQATPSIHCWNHTRRHQKWEREKKNIYSLYGKEIANQYFYRGFLGLMQIEEMQVLMPDSESKSDYIWRKDWHVFIDFGGSRDCLFSSPVSYIMLAREFHSDF